MNCSSQVPRDSPFGLSAKTYDFNSRLYANVSPCAAAVKVAAVADGRGPAPADLAAFNHAVLRARARQRMSPAPVGLRWSWDPALSSFGRLLAAIALDAADLVTSPRASGIGRCADERCGWLFLDLSPGRRRRWCSMSDCGNRAKARRHYARVRRA